MKVCKNFCTTFCLPMSRSKFSVHINSCLLNLLFLPFSALWIWTCSFPVRNSWFQILFPIALCCHCHIFIPPPTHLRLSPPGTQSGSYNTSPNYQQRATIPWQICRHSSWWHLEISCYYNWCQMAKISFPGEIGWTLEGGLYSTISHRGLSPP